MFALVDGAATTQTVSATDTASTDYGNKDGFTLCGSRSYTISPSTYSFLSSVGDVLTLVSTDPAEATVTPLSITISASLDNYPAVPSV